MTLPVEQPPISPSLIDPYTAEVIPLTAPTDRLAEFIDHVREVERHLRDAKADVARELHRRMDAEACWTVRAGRYKVSGESPNRFEYDGDALHKALCVLLEDELITRRALDEAVETVVVHKPRTRGINQLLKLGGDVAEAVLGCRRPLERERRITLGRFE